MPRIRPVNEPRQAYALSRRDREIWNFEIASQKLLGATFPAEKQFSTTNKEFKPFDRFYDDPERDLLNEKTQRFLAEYLMHFNNDPKYGFKFYFGDSINLLKSRPTKRRATEKAVYKVTILPEFTAWVATCKEEKVNRFATVLQIFRHNASTPELTVLLVFYFELSRNAVIVELFFPDLEEMVEHPALEDIHEIIAQFLSQFGVKSVSVGVFMAKPNPKEFLQFLPFVGQSLFPRDQALQKTVFRYIWNLFLFLDRVREPRYTLSNIEDIVTEFPRADVELRERVYLELLMFITQYRLYLLGA